jgi:hypothetical protein
VIAAFAALWPGPSVSRAAAALCIVLAAGCVLGARAFGEPFHTGTLNRWHEAMILLAVAYLALLIF